MAESESEDEILDRIEEALRKIAGVPRNIKPQIEHDDVLDREALSAALDKVIFRLRDALNPPQMPPTE